MDMLRIITTAILEAVLPIFVIVFMYFIVRHLSERLEDLRKTEPNKYEELIKYATVAVRAAEQIYGKEAGARKKAYAMGVVEKMLKDNGIEVNVAGVSAVIESIVFKELNESEYILSVLGKDVNGSDPNNEETEE